jgi:hypothetical protein
MKRGTALALPIGAAKIVSGGSDFHADRPFHYQLTPSGFGGVFSLPSAL